MSGAKWKSFGTDESGFEVSVDGGATSVRVRAWGFWDMPLAVSFTSAVAEACAGARRPSELTIDVVDLRPQRDDVQVAFATLLTSLRDAGLGRLTFVVTSSITKMQLARLAKESKVKDWVCFEAPKTAA